MTKICIYVTRFAETQIFNDMKNKLFILGWDNALVSDIVENKVHPAYLAMLAEVDPNLHARWTLDDTVSMQGEQPEKIWQSFCELLGDEKGRRAREIFYQTYRRLPLPPLTENALPFLRKLNACGCVVAVVSNKTQKILEEEIRMRKLDGLIDIAIGTTEKEEPQGTVGGYDRRFNSRIELLNEAIEEWPDAEEVVVIAGSGYAEPAYVLGVSRFEEASAPVFDWIAGELAEPVSVSAPSASGFMTASDWRDDLL